MKLERLTLLGPVTGLSFRGCELQPGDPLRIPLANGKSLEGTVRRELFTRFDTAVLAYYLDVWIGGTPLSIGLNAGLDVDVA